MAMSILAKGDDVIAIKQIIAEHKNFKLFLSHEFIFDCNKDDREEIDTLHRLSIQVLIKMRGHYEAF